MNVKNIIKMNLSFVSRVIATYNELSFAHIDGALTRWRGDSIVPVKPLREHGR